MSQNYVGEYLIFKKRRKGVYNFNLKMPIEILPLAVTVLVVGQDKTGISNSAELNNKKSIIPTNELCNLTVSYRFGSRSAQNWPISSVKLK